MDSSSDLLNWLEATGLYTDVILRSEADSTRLSSDMLLGLANTSLLIPLLKRLNRLKIAEAAANPSNSKLRSKYWTVVASCFQAFGVSFPADLIAEAVKGTESALLSILKSIYSREQQYDEPKTSPTVKEVNGVTLEAMDTDKSLDESESCLEFLLLSFCGSYDVKPRQATGLLAQGNKFLARIVARGLKGDFGPVQSWYQSVYQSSEKLCDLMVSEKDKDSLTFVLGVLKVGLDSRDVEVVQWCLKTYTKIALDLEDRGLSPKCYSWFLHPSKGALSALISVFQRLGAQVYSNAAEMLIHYTQLNLIEFFSVHLKNVLQEPKDYFGFLIDVMPAIREMEWAVEALNSSRIIIYWVESASRESDGYQSKCRLTCLDFLTLLFTLFHLPADEGDTFLSPLLSTLKKSFRDPLLLIKSSAFSLMMDLLDTLAAARSSLASVVYKTVTVLMMETDPGEPIRELMALQFKRLLATSPAIPVSVLIEPLCKRVLSTQIQSTEGTFPLQMADFELFVGLAKHSRIALKHAIQLIDVLGKVYLSDMVYAKAAMGPFSMLVSRFVDGEAMQEYLGAFVKVGMVQVALCDRTVKEKKARYDKFSTYATEENLHDIQLTRRKRDVVLDMIEWLLQLQHEGLNQRLKEIIVSAALDFRQANNRDCKGLIMLLRVFGEPQTVISAVIAMKTQKGKMEKEAEKEIKNTSEFLSSELEEVKEQAVVPYNPRQTSDQRRGFPWKRAFADIEQAKKKVQDREQKVKEAEEQMKKLMEMKLGKLALQLEVRKVEQGVSRAPASEVAMLQSGQAAKLLAPAEEITLKDFSESEPADQEAVSVLLKKYSRVFKVLFQRYSGSGFARKKEATGSIDWFIERKNRIFDTECIKLFIDHSLLPRLISKEELRTIFKAYCAKVAHQTELTWIDFDGFKGVFCQFAYFAFSREPMDLSHLPPAVAVKALIETMRRETKAMGQSTELYDDPDPGTGDKDVVKHLTKQLATDPDMQLPAGYKRVTDTELAITFSVPKELGIPIAVETALEVVDSVTWSALQIHILEPRIQYFTVHRAKGVPPKKDRVELPPIHERPASLLKRKLKAVSEEEKPIEKPSHLNPLLKFELARCSDDDRPRVKECAELLEDMLHSLSLGTNKVVFREQSQLKPGKTEQMAYAREDKSRVRTEVDEKVRQERKAKAAALIEQLKKTMEEKQKRKAEKEAAERQTREKEKQRGRAIAHKIKEEREAREKQVKEMRLKQAEETRKTKEDEQKTKLAAEEKLKKLKEELKRKMNERLKEAIVRKQKEGQAKKPVVSAKPSLMDELAQRKKQFERVHKEDMKRIEEQKREKESFQKAAESEEIKGVLIMCAKQIECVFYFYCKQSMTRVEQLPDNLLNEMKKADFARFLLHFGVIPDIVSAEDASIVFNHLTKMKSRKFGVPATLTLSDFQTALLHLARQARFEVIPPSTSSPDHHKKAVLTNLPHSKPLTAATMMELLQWMELTTPIRELTRKLKMFPSASERPKRKFRSTASMESLLKSETASMIGLLHDDTIPAGQMNETRLSQPELQEKPNTPPAE